MSYDPSFIAMLEEETGIKRDCFTSDNEYLDAVAKMILNEMLMDFKHMLKMKNESYDEYVARLDAMDICNIIYDHLKVLNYTEYLEYTQKK